MGYEPGISQLVLTAVGLQSARHFRNSAVHTDIILESNVENTDLARLIRATDHHYEALSEIWDYMSFFFYIGSKTSC